MKGIEEDELQAMLEKAAELGAKRALDDLTNRVYQEVGRTVMKRILQLFGALLVAGSIWAAQQGWFK